MTRRGVSGGRLEHGVKHHLAPYQSDQVVVVEGVPVLDAARTAVDMAREHGYVHGTVACDAARQLGVRLSELWEAVAPMTCWPEVTVVRASIQDSDPGAESVGETLGRMLLPRDRSGTDPDPVRAARPHRLGALRHARRSASRRVRRVQEVPPAGPRRPGGRRSRTGRLAGEAAGGLAAWVPPRHVAPRCGPTTGVLAASSPRSEYAGSTRRRGGVRHRISDLAHLIVRHSAYSTSTRPL